MRWLAAMLLCAALACHAQADGGGRDVRVALFSAQPPRNIVVTATGPGAWWAACTTCRHQPLTATLHMPATQEIVAGGPITVTDADRAQVRTANGQWHLRSASQGTVDVVLTLPSERYVAAVLTGETLSSDPHESLRAMAVVARTYVLRLPVARSKTGHLATDVCDSTACQAMKLGPVSDAISDAVRSTAGETLWFGPQRAQVFFSASCGGMTESAGAVWPALSHVPYLQSIADPYCVRKDRAGWHAEVPLGDLQKVAVHEGWSMPPHILSAQITKRTSSQRAQTIVFAASDEKRAVVSAPALRLALGRSLGWNLVRSDAYDLRIRDGLLVFDGRGHGHGVGLCQQGAVEMARAGKSYREILPFYFAGTKLRVTQADEGWKQNSQDGVTATSTAALTLALIRDTVDAWRLAASKFSLRQQIAPTVIFAPTTELFRQLTSQPGWQLASTSGNTIVLQPAPIFASNRVSLQATLQHEMLHVAVEANANSRSPLWLREGLVEVLAGDAVQAKPSLSAEDTERMLRNAANRQESHTAHDAAGARTRLLIERYGLSAVRGWLIAGSPLPAD